jgi:hypothetical protein
LKWNHNETNSGDNLTLLTSNATLCNKCQGTPVINPVWAYGGHKWMQKNYWIACSKCYWSTTSFETLETAIRNWNYLNNYKQGDVWVGETK